MRKELKELKFKPNMGFCYCIMRYYVSSSAPVPPVLLIKQNTEYETYAINFSLYAFSLLDFYNPD